MTTLKLLKRTILTAIALTLAVSCFFYAFPLKHRKLVEKYSAEFNLPPELVYAVINAESRFRENSVSRKGASGLMQLMEITANWGAEELEIENYSYDDIFDPELNIMLGCWYIKKLSAQFSGNVKLILAAYNAGSGNVSGWLNDAQYSGDGKKLDFIPFPETRKYVEKVTSNIKVYGFFLKITGGAND